MPIKFNIAVEDTEETKKLQSDLASARSELNDYKRKFNELEIKYISEIQLNCECIDLLKEHGIRYEKRLSRRERHTK